MDRLRNNLAEELKLTYKSFTDVIYAETESNIIGMSSISLNDFINSFLKRYFEPDKAHSKIVYKSVGGGTYNLEPGENISKLNDPATFFMGDEFNGIRPGTNICIFGGGPNGLFMAILLYYVLHKYGIHIHVVETRVDKEGRRKLERKQQLVNKTTLDITFTEEILFSDFVKFIAPELHAKIFMEDVMMRSEYSNNLIVSKTGLNLMAIIPEYKQFILERDLKMKNDLFVNNPTATFKTDKLQTRVLEFGLAREAQKLGIHIYHESDESIKREPDMLIAKYTNENTIMVFDATGSRLYGDRTNFKVVNTVNPNNRDFVKTTYNEMRIHRTSFDIYEGYLDPNRAIKLLNNGILYVAIGDTTLRSDFRRGKGLGFNWLLELMYMLTIGKTINDMMEGPVPFEMAYNNTSNNTFKNLFDLHGGGKNNSIISRMPSYLEMTTPSQGKINEIVIKQYGHLLPPSFINKSNANKKRAIINTLSKRQKAPNGFKGGKRTRRSTRRTRGRR